MTQLALALDVDDIALVPTPSRVYAAWVSTYQATGDTQQCERLTWRARTNPSGRNWTCAGDRAEPLCAGCEARAWWMVGHDQGLRFYTAERHHHAWHVRTERERLGIGGKDHLDELVLDLEREYGSAKAVIEAIRARADGLYEDYCFEQLLPRLATLDCTHEEAMHYWASRHPVEPGLSRELGGAA